MSYKIHDNVYKKCLTPFDVVTDEYGNVGYIKEININDSQDEEEWQLSYSVSWLVINEGSPKNAWWKHGDLKKHSNIFESFAGNTCHPFGKGRESLSMLKAYIIKEVEV